MNERNKRIISLVYSILLSTVLTLLAVLLVVGCIRIYSLGDAPFTPENIGNEFSKISVLVVIAVLMSVGGGVISLIMGVGTSKKGRRDSLLTLDTLSKKVSLSATGTEAERKALWERNFRRTLKAVSFALYTLGAVLSLFYVLNPNNYAGIQDGAFNPNLDVSKAALAIAICLALPIAFSILLLFLLERSRQREIVLLKTVIASGKAKSAPVELCDINSGVILGVRIAVIGAAVLFIALGAINGGYSDVLSKAVKICQECIGIG